MKKLLYLLTTFAWLGAAAESPIADPRAVVVAGNARFTVLTPELIRMEWSDKAQFEDRASLAIVNRQTEVPDFKVKQSASKVEISTSAVRLTYKKGKRFSDDNLSVRFKVGERDVVWTPSAEDTQNLLGTCRTLDGAEGDKLKEPLEKGLLSRGGWALVDESRRHLFAPDDSHWGEWVASRADTTAVDWYLFAYGHNYKRALSDYAVVAGRSPMPPKYAFGYWWSRYWQYSDNEFRDLVAQIKSFNIPIDVLIVDMDWHETWGLRSKGSARDDYGQRVGWTGYTWQPQLFPSPENFMRWTKNERLKTALNLHPASGIEPFESVYNDFVKDYGWSEKGKGVPFHIDEVRWADSYFKTVLEPMERMGVDFWWLDWQQWKQSKYTPGLSNTFWLNHVFFNHMKSTYPAVRPMIYHRWGGLGSHRYQVAFSGDTYSSWKMLAYLPYFTSTASNVNYGYWGHDIGGHMQREDATNPELYTRWLQYGVFTPIFKTHSTKTPKIERRIWQFPDYMPYMRDAIRLRYTLAPYVYNAARANYDTGVSMSRPMYYDYPEADQAYDYREQFMFGDDIIATAVASPIDKTTQLAEREIWFPNGRWYDYSTGAMYEGNAVRKLHYTLAENPYYAKAGAIIPMNPSNVKNLQSDCDTLVLSFTPGADGRLDYYEDDGVSEEYTSKFAKTAITIESDGVKKHITIAPRRGTFDGAPAERCYTLRLPATYPPTKVEVNGRELPYSRFPRQGEWSYDGYELATIIYTDMLPCDQATTVNLTFSTYGAEHQGDLYGLSGIFRRCIDLTTEFKLVQGKVDNMMMLPQEYLVVAQTPNYILEDCSNIADYISEFKRHRMKMLDIIDAMPEIDASFKSRLRANIATVE